MDIKSLFIILLLVVGSHASYSSYIDDLINKTVTAFWPKNKDTAIKKWPKIDFELPPEDDEFLKQGLEMIQAPLGELDLCSHNVVLKLEKNCNKLTLEEIGKLAIMFMNCQLEAENRAPFSCKPEMTLEQCTSKMDPNMYKIFHLMNHRTVNLCSALKNDQFRAMTEMTINRLQNLVESNTIAMDEALKKTQKLNAMGDQNIRDLEEHKEKIKQSQLDVYGDVVRTAESVDDMALKVHGLVKLVDELNNQASKQNEESKKLGLQLDSVNRQMVSHYENTMDFLEIFNSMVDLAAKFSSVIGSTLWALRLALGEIGIDITAEFFVLSVINMVYFTAGMIFMLFMDFGSVTKNILIGLVVFNTLAAYFKSEINIAGTNVIVWIFYMTFFRLLPALKRKIVQLYAMIPSISFSLTKVKNIIPKRRASETESDDSHEKTPERVREKSKSKTPMRYTHPVQTPTSRYTEDYNDMIKTPVPNAASSRATTPIPFARAMSPALARVRSDIHLERAATPFFNQQNRIQCQGTTAKGAQCKNAAQPGYDTCRIHYVSR